MKKTYIKPATDTVAIDIEAPMMAGTTVTNKPTTPDGQTTDPTIGDGTVGSGDDMDADAKGSGSIWDFDDEF